LNKFESLRLEFPADKKFLKFSTRTRLAPWVDPIRGHLWKYNVYLRIYKTIGWPIATLLPAL